MAMSQWAGDSASCPTAAAESPYVGFKSNVNKEYGNKEAVCDNPEFVFDFMSVRCLSDQDSGEVGSGNCGNRADIFSSPCEEKTQCDCESNSGFTDR